MSRSFRLRLASFGTVVADDDRVVALNARDASGSFGLLAGHADFLTALTPSVVSWRLEDGRQRHCAIRGGVLTMTGGTTVEIATRAAVLGDDPAGLETNVVAGLRQAEAAESSARRDQHRVEIRTLRQIMRYLDPGA